MRPAHAALVASLVLASCARVPRDPSADALALLHARLGGDVAIQSAVVSQEGALICGYAFRQGASAFVLPFIVQRDTLLLQRDDPAAYEAAQRSCGPDWVKPNNDIQPIA
jgi:hypothetical protein